MIIIGIFILVAVTVISIVWLIHDDFSSIRNNLIIPTLIGVIFIFTDIYLASSSKYIVTEQLVSNKYELRGNNLYFPRPLLIKVYEKDCTGFSITKEKYRYITIGEDK